MMARWAAAALLCFAVGAAGAEEVPEPDGYRLNQYRAAVPATLLGAPALTTAEAHALWEAGSAIFVDVMPKPAKPARLPPGTLWTEPKRSTIEGASWLPNTGFGALTPDTELYFARALELLTGGDRSAQLVIFCLTDCWMSWNAARRAAIDLGYEGVRWYPDGMDGWAAAGHPVETVTTWLPPD